MQKAQLAAIALLLMTSTAIAGAPTDASCWMTNSSTAPGAPPIRRWADTTQQINVFVDVTTANGVQSVFYNPIYVAKATEIAVERWNEQAGIPQRLVFAGFKTDTGPQPQSSVVIRAGGCAAEALGAATGGCTLGTSGFCTTGVVSLFLAPTQFCSNFRYADGFSNANDQGGFVDLLVHELGHTLGRHDAYKTACGISNQTTVMETSSVQRRDLTDFDRSEMQAVYGSRAATNALMRRTLEWTTSPWGPPADTLIANVDIAPGPGSSWGTAVPVTTVQFINAIPRIVVSLFTGAQTWAGDTMLIGQYPARKPVSTSLGPNGAGVMAYMAEDGGNDSTRRLCIRRRTNGNWSGETCSNPCTGQLPNNAVSTAYDPLSGRFFVAHACETPQTTLKIRVAALATSAFCTSLRCAEVSAQFDISAAETPVVACAPVGQSGSNCRLVYAQRNVVGQRIGWRSFGFIPGFTNQLTFGSENQTQIESEHAPAVTYFGDAFQMALTLDGTVLTTYYMFPSSSTWVNDGHLNTTGWISPPFYSTSQHCATWGMYTTCYDQLQLFWLQYRS